MTACLLALDTATEQLAAALLCDGQRRCIDAPGGALASTRLIPLLMGLLADAGLGLAQVQAVAFGRGPGAFTGLRTACAVAQGLAFAYRTPVLAIDSLLIVAEDARVQAETQVSTQAQGDTHPAGNDWWVAMDARMDEVYAAAYHHGADGWQVLQAPQLWTLPALAAAWHSAPPRQVAGSAVCVFAQRLPFGAARCWPHTAHRAQALLRLAEAAWARGEGQSAEQALPIYLRDKVAQTTAERLAQRAAGPLATGLPA